MRVRPTGSTIALFVIALLALLPISETAAQLERPEDVVKITPALPKTGFNPGEVFQAALVLDIIDGYHLNAHTVKDPAMIPTDLEVPEDAPLQFQFVRYPEDQAKSGEIVEGYHDDQYHERVMIRLVGRVPADAELGSLKVPMVIRYQTCTDTVCLYPYGKPTELEIPVVAPGTKVEAINKEIFGKPGL